MSGLNPELQKLLPAYKNANSPTDVDAARILEGLRARLGVGAFAAIESAPVVATTASTATTGLFVMEGAAIGLAALAALGGLWYLGTRPPPLVDATQMRSEPIAAFPAPAATEPQCATSGSGSESLQPEATRAATATLANVDARPLAGHHARDKLADEVAVLARAQAALRSGRPASALDVLNEYERKFSNGLLAEECTAARVHALCALGRTAEANAQVTQLSPKSLHGQLQLQACGARR
ncbi:MAG TPA: hypothetical protein VIV60_09230 [Polyangiaceae bacterium]